MHADDPDSFAMVVLGEISAGTKVKFLLHVYLKRCRYSLRMMRGRVLTSAILRGYWLLQHQRLFLRVRRLRTLLQV